MLKLKNYVRGRYIYYERIGGHGGSASGDNSMDMWVSGSRSAI